MLAESVHASGVTAVVLPLAAALSIPLVDDAGAPVPFRDLVQVPVVVPPSQRPPSRRGRDGLWLQWRWMRLLIKPECAAPRSCAAIPR